MHQSPEQLWPEQPHSSFCPCEAKMGRSHSSKGAVMAWDEMDGDSTLLLPRSVEKKYLAF